MTNWPEHLTDEQLELYALEKAKELNHNLDIVPDMIKRLSKEMEWERDHLQLSRGNRDVLLDMLRLRLTDKEYAEITEQSKAQYLAEKRLSEILYNAIRDIEVYKYYHVYQKRHKFYEQEVNEIKNSIRCLINKFDVEEFRKPPDDN